MYSNNCDCEKNNYISYINCYLQFQDWSQNRGTETWGITIWLEKVEFWYWGHHDCRLPRAHSLFSTIKIYIYIRYLYQFFVYTCQISVLFLLELLQAFFFSKVRVPTIIFGNTYPISGWKLTSCTKFCCTHLETEKMTYGSSKFYVHSTYVVLCVVHDMYAPYITFIVL